ncbi:MAG: DUF3631 domain-containing protein [Gallionella sp.]
MSADAREFLDAIAVQRDQGKPKTMGKAMDGAELLDAVRDFLASFIAFPSIANLETATLWAAHAHMIEHFHTTPRLAVISAEPESGKSRVLEILELLTPHSMLCLSPSPASIFRKLAQEQITLLLDETDTIFTARGKDDQNEELRAMLNAGYRRGASIPRCVGPKHDVVDFQVFGAVALAGIGDLPDTITTRSIIIRMRRRSATEPIEPYRSRLYELPGHELRDQLAAWAESVGEAVGNAWPELPEGVTDRRAEAWEPLIAVADAAGGEWPERARVAAVTDVTSHRGREPTLGIRLLGDLRLLFKDREAIATEEILRTLNEMEEAPWGDLRGRPLDSRGLARRLKKYGVQSKTVRIGISTHKGYTSQDLFDVWSRYLPSHPLASVTSVTNDTTEENSAMGEPPIDGATSATSATLEEI